MSGNENITRAKAQERSQLIESRTYHVLLNMTTGPTTFATTTTVTFGCRTPGSSTRIDLIAPTVTSVVLNGLAQKHRCC